MKIWTLAGSTALATLALTGMAHADLTPDEVWADWQAMGKAWDQTVTAQSQRNDGDALVLSGVTVISEQADTRVEGTIDTITMRDKGDGTVEITASEAYPMTITTTAPPVEGQTEGGPVTVKLNIVQNGMVMTASGEVGDTRYDYVIPMLAVDLQEIDTPNGGDETFKMKIAANNTRGSYDLTGEARDLASETTVGNLVATFSALNPNTGGTFNMNAEMAKVVAKSTAANMGTMASGNVVAALKDGFASMAELAYESSRVTFDFTEGENTAKGNGTSGKGTLDLAMDESKLGYGGSAEDVQLTVEASQLPFPVRLAYDSSSFDFAMPIVAGDAPQDYTFATRTEGLTVSDEVWAMFDPAGVLPRDPATLVIDTSGTATIDVDFMDPAQAEAVAGQAPGEVNSLDVNELHLAFAGADLTGTGALTFDNSDYTTFEGFPAPTGKLDLRLVGGNGLIEKGVQMGLIPQDQALGARMMLGMFARVVEGAEDTVTSEIEFREKHLYVNGQMLQ